MVQGERDSPHQQGRVGLSDSEQGRQRQRGLLTLRGIHGWTERRGDQK